MASRGLELEVLHGQRHEDYIHVIADPDSDRVMAGFLVKWLRDNKWDAGRWGEFTLAVRYEGELAVRKRVGAS